MKCDWKKNTIQCGPKTVRCKKQKIMCRINKFLQWNPSSATKQEI